MAVRDGRNERQASVAVQGDGRGDGGFLVRQAGIAGGRQSTAGQAAEKDGHQPLHDEKSRHVRVDYPLSFLSCELFTYVFTQVPHALAVKDGLTANVPTATPVPAVTAIICASDPEQSTVLAISIHDPLATPLLHPAPWARLIHESQILSDVAQCESPLAAFVSADGEQEA